MATHDEVSRLTRSGADSGCTVDWSWLAGQEIESVTSDLQHWQVRFKSGLTLSIQAAPTRARRSWRSTRGRPRPERERPHPAAPSPSRWRGGSGSSTLHLSSALGRRV